MKRNYFSFFSFLILFCIIMEGCTFSQPAQDPIDDSGNVAVGHSFIVKNTDERLSISEKKDALSADGLYYATWVSGNSEAYKNSEGDTVDLYDAQLYLLLNETKSGESAKHNMETWLAAARTNYAVTKKEETVNNGIHYTLLTYDCKSKESPYDRGISAFGTFGENAVCIELTCRADFEEDLEDMLTGFLDNCYCNVNDMD